MAPAIELEDVGRAYGERTALAGVTLTLEPGRTLAVFGANGAGKTTLLRILATLLKPHAGRARVLGRDLPAEGWAVRGRVGLLAHDPLLYRELSARENLELPRAAARRGARAGRGAAGAGRAARAGRRAGADALARHGAAGGDLPRCRCTSRSCCCSTSRWRTSTRARRRRSSR